MNEITGKILQKQQKEYQKLYTLLLELIGYDNEWLTTEAGLNKYNKKELVEIILHQRSLMKKLFEELDEEKQTKLKVKIESALWEVLNKK
ncbi:MAG TPA: hypothetical protein VEY70_19785 [Metabacillus sp.]|nr:hypothetical protein [Metabacillus sp.]